MSSSNLPYNFIEPNGKKVPFMLSIPHCGLQFPSELQDRYIPEQTEFIDDTDFYLDRLYDFASELGVTVIFAKYSRWVIDLNRDPNFTPLYDDGRLITELCPTTDFLGKDIYLNKEFLPNDKEKQRRLREYFYPYHQKIDEVITELKNEFGKVIFWDGHSIRRNVETIQKEPFPDFILGNNDGKTADEKIINIALESLNSKDYKVNHNHPFKGGFLTRSKGNPTKNVHALQLEMSKDLYMSKNETVYDETKAKVIKELLKQTFERLIGEILD